MMFKDLVFGPYMTAVGMNHGSHWLRSQILVDENDDKYAVYTRLDEGRYQVMPLIYVDAGTEVARWRSKYILTSDCPLNHSPFEVQCLIANMTTYAEE